MYGVGSLDLLVGEIVGYLRTQYFVIRCRVLIVTIYGKDRASTALSPDLTDNVSNGFLRHG